MKRKTQFGFFDIAERMPKLTQMASPLLGLDGMNCSGQVISDTPIGYFAAIFFRKS